MHWDVVWQNLDYFLIGAWPHGKLGGLALSIALALVGIFGAFWLGLVVGLMRLSKSAVARWVSLAYVEIIRGVPLIMVIFWLYFLAPIVLGFKLPDFQSAALAFIIFTSAYIAEIVRAGVDGLPKGQMEAARATGLTRLQAMRLVILPQALRNMIPSYVNQFVSLTKDTSLAAIIGVGELFNAAEQVSNRELVAPTEIFLTVAVIYFVVCYALTAFSRHLERGLSRYQGR